jgi:hypothetical protein
MTSHDNATSRRIPIDRVRPESRLRLVVRCTMFPVICIVLALVASDASAQTGCSNLMPSGGDDSSVIRDCLNNQGIAVLAPNTTMPVTFRLDSAIKITRPGAQLVGKRNSSGSANLTTLKVYVPSCPTPDYGAPAGLDNAGGPWIQIQPNGKRKWRHVIKADFSGTSAQAGVGIKNIDVDVTDLGYLCNYVSLNGSTGTIFGSFLVVIDDAPASALEYVSLIGTPVPFGQPTGRGPGGSANGGIAIISSPDSMVRFCRIQNVGYYTEADSGGTDAIQVKSSRNALVEGCTATGVSFGIVVENDVSDAGDSSYSRVINNNVDGVAHLTNCPPCAGGRGIKLEACDGGGNVAVPLRYVLVQGNTISHFGNNPQRTDSPNGSGLHLTCNVQNSTLLSNTVSVENTAGGALLISGRYNDGPIVPTVLNTFQNNSFTGGHYADVYFYAPGNDQIGIGRGSVSGSNGNTFSSLRSEATPAVCPDYSRGQLRFPATGQINFGTIVEGNQLTLQGWSIDQVSNDEVLFKFKNASGATVLIQYHPAGGCGRIGNQYTLPLVPGKYYVSAKWTDLETATTTGDVGIGIVRVLSPTGGDSIGTYVPSGSTWFLKNSNSNGSADLAFNYGGLSTAIPLMDDWNGDGIDTPGIYDPATSTFYLRDSNTPGVADTTLTFGGAGVGYIPITGDWNGDGSSSIGLYNPNTGAFFLKNWNTPGGADIAFVYGPTGNVSVPVVGDWNGDLVDSIGIYVPSSAAFFLRNSNSGGVADLSFIYGPTGASPIVGDWNRDGLVTVGIYHPASAVFFLRNQNNAGPADLTFAFGAPNSKPLAGNWDGR